MSIEQLEKQLQDSKPAAPPPPVDSPLTLVDFVDPSQLQSDVKFQLHDLDNAIRDQASLYVFYADRARQARRQHERMKVTAEVLESKLYAIHRANLLEAGTKPTKDQIDAAVRMDPRWFAAQQKVIDARAIMDLALDAREALQQRKDMLIQVSVDRRREREGEMAIGGGRQQQHVETSKKAVLDMLAGIDS